MPYAATFRQVSRVALTLGVVAVACVVGWFMWRHYEYDPWTRDALVEADVINVAPEVSGTVIKVAVRDDQPVRRGKMLFRIDSRPYRAALNQAQAEVNQAAARLQLARDERARAERLFKTKAVSQEELTARVQAERMAAARRKAAQAAVQVAALDLGWSVVRSPVGGYVTHLLLDEGDYATQGRDAMTLVDRHSFRITGYFEETKLRHIHIGDAATVKLMAGGPVLCGHVASISRGIAVGNNVPGERNLAQVDPTYQWVRLAQRIPVIIHLDHAPPGVELRIGLTATVIIKPRGGRGTRPTSMVSH